MEEWTIVTAIKYYLPQRSMDCTSELNQVIYSDSEISENLTCARTKTKALLDEVLAQHLVDNSNSDINISCLCVSTNDSNHGSLKLFPVVINIFINFMLVNQN
jgi:uncharacterized protein YpmS